jgi:hypothetical protein
MNCANEYDEKFGSGNMFILPGLILHFPIFASELLRAILIDSRYLTGTWFGSYSKKDPMNQ